MRKLTGPQRVLFDKYIGLADHIACQAWVAIGSRSHLFDRDDVFAWSHIGLLDAVRRYRPSRGASFATYATWRIRGTINDGMRGSEWASRRLRRSGVCRATIASLDACIPGSSVLLRDVLESHADQRMSDLETTDALDAMSSDLTGVESVIFALLRSGKSTQQIAEYTGLPVQQVLTHKHTILVTCRARAGGRP